MELNSMIKAIAKIMFLEENFLQEISKTASSRYTKFKIKKRHGGERVIYDPAKELKAIQRIILDNFLIKLPISNSAYAYMKGLSIKDAVKKHLGQKYFLRIDLRNFFNSIKKSDLEKYFNDLVLNKKIEISYLDIQFLLNICCFNESLVIGAVTSPYLSNAICYELDKIISDKCKIEGIIYTRYADDMFFSVDKKNILHHFPKQIESILKTLKYPNTLQINYNKTIHSSHSKRINILGLNITNDNKISIGRSKKREIRSKIFKWTTSSIEEKQWLQGTLSYCKSVEPEFITNLCMKYDAKLISEILKFNITK